MANGSLSPKGEHKANVATISPGLSAPARLVTARQMYPKLDQYQREGHHALLKLRTGIMMPSCATASADAHLRTGTHVVGATGLGPRPVALSQPLMEAWLTPEDLQQLRCAYRVSTGRSRIVERIDRRMAEFGEAEQKRRWLSYWSRAANQQPAAQDVAYVEELRAVFQSERNPAGG